ncbi:flagellar assembly protein FliH [Virgibacillus sp. 179-BFC.A HS]|uniref:Flagellar assembly protein FliH n=1 Tax=Tigheibacillus jepli TaxID=3035914 RepID=A0ABU5CHP5_9BACI|nr:flagellar assembly protein FliH [Virgibacillus sp. 179-BFC.A HS]MDY0405887.1 flagellar assembly protein FliH [Virgibacillus sp. 179-BFC.A HS]
MSELRHMKQIKIKPIAMQQAEDTFSLSAKADGLKQNIRELEMEVAQLEEQKNKLIQQTNERIKGEQAKWEEQKQQLMEQAQKEGYAKGFQSGEQKGKQTYDDVIQKINAMAELAKKDYYATIAQSKDAILDIAIASANKILRQQLPDHPELFQRVVNDCISEINDVSDVTIYVHPNQYEIVIQQKHELQQLLQEDARLLVKVKNTLPEFGCVIDCPSGQIDASVDTQLDQIRNALGEIRMEN